MNDMKSQSENEIERFYDNNEDEEIIQGRIFIEKKDFTIREYHSMHEDGDLILQPEYQRNYVVDSKFACKLIESIILDVPIPPVFLAEEEEGKYSVIDGQQRLTSFIHFIKGVFPDNKPFKLNSVKQLTIGQGKGKTYAEITDREIKNKIKSTTIQAIIIKRHSHEELKFAIFERLNTGSVKLNEDELRNSIYRGNYIRLLAELENDSNFHVLMDNDKLKSRMGYRGMILRFLALSEKSYINYKSSMQQFCNKELREFRNLSQDKQNEYRDRFKKCSELVKIVFGENAFKRYLPKENHYSKSFNKALFDIQMCGFVGYSKNQIIGKADEIRMAMFELMQNNTDNLNEYLEQKTNDTNTLKNRFKIWFDTLEKIVGKSLEEPRIFSLEQKVELFNKNSGKCAICGQQILNLDDAEADHIVAYSNGGKTIIENGQITHKFCNRSKGNKPITENQNKIQSHFNTELTNIEQSNKYILIFTDKQNYFRIENNFSDLSEVKKNLEENNEKIIYKTGTDDYSGFMLFGFKNGLVAKISLNSYQTSHKRLSNAYNSESPLVFIYKILEDVNIAVRSSKDTKGRNIVMMFNTSQINSVGTKNSIGVRTIKLQDQRYVEKYAIIKNEDLQKMQYYNGAVLSRAGNILRESDRNVFEQ